PSALCLSSVMEKAGLKYEKDAHFYNLDVVYYALTRAAWQPDESSYTPLL
ncbi:GNAT family N-acetyltransferase, partial [Fischerella thermalis CCMEE 5319]